VGVLQEKLKKFSNPGNVFMLQAVWEALEDAGITAQEIYGTRFGERALAKPPSVRAFRLMCQPYDW
jgi:hypothetical protein